MSHAGQFLTQSCANEFALNFSIIMEAYRHFIAVVRVVQLAQDSHRTTPASIRRHEVF